MTFYTMNQPVSRTITYRPVREVHLSTTGMLLSAGTPRYDTLNEYMTQFAAPLSQLRGGGLWTFHDPTRPELCLLLECEAEPSCDRCHHPLDGCECPF